MSPLSAAPAAVLAILVMSPAAAGGQDAAAPCVAVVLPSVQGVEGTATDVGAGLRDLFISYLNGPALRAIALDARLPMQAAIEAQQKGCERMLLTAMVRKRGGDNKFSGILGQAAGTAAWHMPYGTGVGAAAVRGAAIAGAQAASSLAADTRRKDEIRLEYRVGTPEAVAGAKAVSSKAKARSDGEDLLTPLVERASSEIVSAIVAK